MPPRRDVPQAVLSTMRDDWNQRAREDAYYYVGFAASAVQLYCYPMKMEMLNHVLKTKSLIVVIACSVLLTAAAHAATILSVSGPVGGSNLVIGANTQIVAVDWSQTVSFSNVNIAADIAVHTGGVANAWLMTQIGPGTTTLEQVATTSVSGLPFPTFSFVNLFSNLTLGPGTYYLVLSASSPGAIWGGTTDANATVVAAAGVSRPATVLTAGLNGLPDYVFPPDSTFASFPTSAGLDYNVEYQVTSGVPEPSTLFLTSAGLLGAIIIRKRLSLRTQV